MANRSRDYAESFFVLMECLEQTLLCLDNANQEKLKLLANNFSKNIRGFAGCISQDGDYKKINAICHNFKKMVGLISVVGELQDTGEELYISDDLQFLPVLQKIENKELAITDKISKAPELTPEEKSLREQVAISYDLCCEYIETEPINKYIEIYFYELLESLKALSRYELSEILVGKVYAKIDELIIEWQKRLESYSEHKPKKTFNGKPKEEAVKAFDAEIGEAGKRIARINERIQNAGQ